MRRLENCSDAELLARSASDRQAFGRFYQRHERLIVGFFMSRTRNPELAADLTAETFAIVLEIAERFDPGREAGGCAVPWLVSIARHTMAASARRGSVADDARRRLACDPVALDD